MKNLHYNNKFSTDHIKFLKDKRRENILTHFFRTIILLLFLGLWELLAQLNIIDSFITSSPSKIFTTIRDLFANDNLIYHIGITLYETLFGFIITVILGFSLALLLWWSKPLKKILEPYIVVLNSLPKIALGPIIIVWCGSGNKAIILMTILIGIIVSLITMLNGFYQTDENKITLLKSMGASKLQIMTKLVIPESLPTFISMLKVGVGMAWIGSIMGEYLVSKAGLGYLIVYGSQVFKLDLVMASTVILCFLATLMYVIIAIIEKKLVRFSS